MLADTPKIARPDHGLLGAINLIRDLIVSLGACSGELDQDIDLSRVETSYCEVDFEKRQVAKFQGQ